MDKKIVLFERIGILECFLVFFFSKIKKERCFYIEISFCAVWIIEKFALRVERLDYMKFDHLFYRNQYLAYKLANKHVVMRDQKFIFSVLSWLSPSIDFDNALKKDMCNFYLLHKSVTIGIVNDLIENSNVSLVQYDGLVIDEYINNSQFLRQIKGIRCICNRWKDTILVLPRVAYLLSMLLSKSILYGRGLSKKDFSIVHYELGNAISFDSYYGKENILYYFFDTPNIKNDATYYRIQSSPPFSISLFFCCIKVILFSFLFMSYYFFVSRLYFTFLPLLRALTYYIEDYYNLKDITFNGIFSMDAQLHRHPIKTEVANQKGAWTICYDIGFYQGVIDSRYFFNTYTLCCLMGQHNEYFNSIGSKVFSYIPVGSYEISNYLKGEKDDSLSDNAREIIRAIKDKKKQYKIILVAPGGGAPHAKDLYFSYPLAKDITMFYAKLSRYMLHRTDSFFIIKEKDLKNFYQYGGEEIISLGNKDTYLLCDNNDISFIKLLPVADMVIGGGSSPNTFACVSGKRQITYKTYKCKRNPEYLDGKYKRLFPVVYPEDDCIKLTDTVLDGIQPDRKDQLYKDFVKEYVFNYDDEAVDRMAAVMMRWEANKYTREAA